MNVQRLNEKKPNTINYQTTYSRQLFLNSRNADIVMNGSNKSSVVFFFKDILKIDKTTIEQRLDLVNIQVPVSWYLINETNNTFYIDNLPFYFPEGNYNANTFMITWVSFMGATWAVTFDNILNKLTFYNSINFKISDGVNSIFDIIGFEKGKTYGSAFNITAPFCCNFGGLQKININSSTFNLKNADSKTKSVSSTLASIPVSSIQGGYIFYQNITNFKAVFKNHELSSINIDILDDYGNFINFNGLDWSMTLQLDTICEVIQALDTLEDIYIDASQEV